MHKNQFKLLTKRRFLPLFITQFLEAFNDTAFKNAMVMLITYRLVTSTSKQGILIAIASGLFILPFFLFSATAGQLADKFEKNKLVRIIKVFEIIFMLVGAVGIYQESFPIMMTSLFLMGSHSAFFGPIKLAILPDHLKRDELIGGNALIESGTFISILFGTMFGGALILTSYGYFAVSFVLVLFAVLGWISSFFIPHAPAADPKLKINLNIVSETWDIIRHTRKHYHAFGAIMGISWFWLVGSVFLTELPSFVRADLNASPMMVTLCLAVFSIGIALGSLIVNKLLDGEITSKYVPVGVLGMSVFIFDLCLNTHQFAAANMGNMIHLNAFFSQLIGWQIIFDLLFIAITGGIYIVPLYAILQTRVEAEYRSRAIACNNIISSFFMVLGATFALLLLSLNYSVLEVFLTIGFLNALVAVFICKLLPEALIKSFIKWILRAIYQVDVVGMDNYKKAGDRVIIIANNVSYIDILFISAFLPDKYTIAVSKTFAKKWWLKPLISLVETHPIEPTSPMTTKSLVNIIRSGKKCVIFPEGRLTMSGSLMKIYEGSGLIAHRSGAELLPVRIDGAQFSIFSKMRGKVKRHWFPKVTLTILPPRKISVDPNLSGRQRRSQMAITLYKIITDMIFESSPYKNTLFKALINARAVHGNGFIIAEDTQRKPINYSQFIARSFILGNAIKKQTKPNEIIGLLLPTSNAAMISFFATHAFKRIPAMLNFSAGYHAIISACHTAQIKTVYTSKLFVAKANLDDIVEKVIEAGVTVHYLEDFRKTIGLVAKLRGLWQGRYAQTAYLNTAPNAQPSDPAVVLFTSGSEGQPKAVVLSHENLLANIYQISARVDFGPQDLMFNALPVFHSFGLTAGAILPLVTGMRTFFYPSPLHYRVVPELVYDTNATIMFGTDTFLAGYARYAHPYDFYSLRYVFAGAERVKPETIQIWGEKFGVRIFEGYGATETAPVISCNSPMLNKLGTVGCPLPSIEYKLQPVEGIEQGGRLFITGPNVMLGYIRHDKPGVIQAPDNGWHDTGDIVDIDTEGYVTIKGRAKRFAKVGGEMVSLTAVECHINTLWKDHQNAVVSIADPKRGEQLILFTTNPEASRDSIVKFARDKGIGELNIPRSIRIIDELPVLATGKTDYVTIQKSI